MTHLYDELKRTVESAGFFTTPMPMRDDSHRLVCAARLLADRAGLGGNSFWVARRSSGWFLGSWGDHVYRIPDTVDPSQVCVSWLRRTPDTTPWDVHPEITAQFGLVEIDLDDLPPV